MNLDIGSTLIYAIDTTGSMSEEIDEAKKIAKDIIKNYNLPKELTYILAPFNDPSKFQSIYSQ